MKSGSPIDHVSVLANVGAGGMSFGSPLAAPLSTHFTIVSISFSERDGSSRISLIPTVGSRFHGGISRRLTRVLIARAHGRASSYVSSDIGATCPGRWHDTHDRIMIGATSFVNV